ncbi:hypothetical protein [Fulvivirga ligni]|uniref:hypothetical protein n=1 Tax=Fulvivirga ligni TaxID=2904246 RepID=UPI001F316DFB|nr:hypothetical protein [Fulvivirga ligni]UII19044.1 hypothetical protein LVD16_14460 [Fulvivirga ligni]
MINSKEFQLFNYSYYKFLGTGYDLNSFNNSVELFGYLKLLEKSDPPDLIFMKMDIDLDLNEFQIIVKLRALGIERICVLLGYFFSY